MTGSHKGRLFWMLFLLIGPAVLLFFAGGTESETSGEQGPYLVTKAEKNAWQIWSLLEQKGYSEAARAGILGNVDQETGHTFEPDTEEVGGGGYGLIQWTPKATLLAHLEQSQILGDHKDIQTQVEVIDWELSGAGRGYLATEGYPITFDAFKQLTDPRNAAAVYEANRERPKELHPERQDLAEQWYERFTGLVGPGGSESPSQSLSGITSIALKELGNVGGQKFWTWYGYPARVEWCAVFVSWCADQAGINLKKFSYCPTGVSDFKEAGKWQSAGTVPREGAVIFFDWEGDGVSDHVGLVLKYEQGFIYTVEGNSNDQVRQQVYERQAAVIYGYGLL